MTSTLRINALELHPWENPRYDMNPIYRVPIEVCGYQRKQFLGDDGRYPITMSILGTQNCVWGIKITIFDPSCAEENGTFLHVEDIPWRKFEAVEVKKPSKKYTDNNTLEDISNLGWVMGKVGWKILDKSILLNKNPHTGRYELKIKHPSAPLATYSINHLDTYINMQNILLYYKTLDE